MSTFLPLELLQTLHRDCPCRESQLRQLATFFNPTFPSPPILVAHGLEKTGKLKAVVSILEARKISYALVKSKDSLSQRHLLSKIFATCVKAFGDTHHADDKIDSINALVSSLQKLFRGREDSVVLVIDGIDKQRGAGPTLLPALARLGDIISNLSVILISSSPRPLLLHKPGVPYIHFPPYSRTEALTLLNSSSPIPSLPTLQLRAGPNVDDKALQKIYLQFTAAVYDSLVAPTSSTSITVLKSTCERLWPRFIWPYVSGQAPPSKAKTWDFTKLMVQNRPLFQADGEQVLIERLRPMPGLWTFDELIATLPPHTLTNGTGLPVSASAPPPLMTASASASSQIPLPRVIEPQPPLLKNFATLLLVSSYLASHTPPKHDIILFSRLSSGSKSYKIRRRKIFQSPKTKKSASEPGTPSKAQSSKSLFDGKLGVARPFTLERVVAILRAIHPQGVSGRRGVADRLYREMSELERLRLVVCVGGGAGEDSEERWRVNVGKETVEDLGKRWGIGMREYEVE